MAHIFVRVELRGSPTKEVYDSLHKVMETNGWSRYITGTAGTSTLPHAVYHGDSANPPVAIAKALRKVIQTEVWTVAVVLTMESSNWAMDPA